MQPVVTVSSHLFEIQVAKLFANSACITLTAFISPYCADRDFARELHKNSDVAFIEVFVDAPLSVVESRDPKGLYKKARAGEIKGIVDSFSMLSILVKLNLRSNS